jgi:hypothetical protein
MGAIAQAIWVAPDARRAFYLSWDGSNFNINTGSGEHLSVSFTPERVVGAAYDIHSPRYPFRTHYRPFGGDHYDPLAYVAGAPAAVVALAQAKPLRYLMDELQGVLQPIVTAAFWSEGELLAAAEPWPQVVEHGAHVLRIELLEPDAALPEWENEFGFSEAQVRLLASLFQRRLAAPDGQIWLTAEERRLLTAEGEAGVDESRALLAAVGIGWAAPEP